MQKIYEESYLLAKISKNKISILKKKNSKKAYCSASLTKVFFASEILRLIDLGKIKNSQIEIEQSNIDGTGTDILADLIKGKNKISIDTITLIGLMIKYSCNSSTKILVNKYLSDRNELQKTVINQWKLCDTVLIDRSNNIKTDFSLNDLSVLFTKVYLTEGLNWNFFREKLRTSRNIYYLFDQLKVRVLGSKSGTIKMDKKYHISDCGIVKIKGGIYFLGAMVTSNEISDAVLRIRKIGKELIASLDRKSI